MNKKLLIIAAFIIILLVGFIYFKFFNEEKTEPILQKGLVIISPKLNEEVSFSFKITGYVNGDGWTGFEGQVGTVALKSLSDSGTGEVAIDVLDTAILRATTEWTSLPTYFEAELNFDPALATGDVILFFQNENPSGLPENYRSFVLPVKVKNEEVQKDILQL